MKKEKYVSAEMEVVKFEAEDVITTSTPLVPFGMDDFDAE
jgi:hypothetical protein